MNSYTPTKVLDPSPSAITALISNVSLGVERGIAKFEEITFDF